MAGGTIMTTCAECLSVLSTTRLSDIPRDSAVSSHLLTCPSCSRLVTDMKYADERLALALDSSIPTTPPSTIASNAIFTGPELEHRELVAKWFRRALAVAAGFIAVMFLRSDVGRYMTGHDDFERQTIVLKCISSEEAMALATPYLRSNVGRVYRAGDLSMITVQGRSQEVETALNQIERAERDAPQCQLPAPAPKAIPSVEKQGKD
jgi:hypothetical protein